MKSARLVLAAILLFLVVAVDFTGWLMSVLADGVLVAMVTVLLWPLLRKSEVTSYKRYLRVPLIKFFRAADRPFHFQEIKCV